MAQTGIPFGEIAAVRDWLKISKPIGRPTPEHPKRPILGMECSRSEVSGRRLWGLFSSRSGTPTVFFQDQFVANYCPLVFMDAGARNVTPDKLPSAEWGSLREACDRHLAQTMTLLRPEFLVGVGQFAEQCLKRVAETNALSSVRILRILHPSPASPAANRGWAEAVEKVLVENGVWSKKPK
jgi:single-strand selective monofunctional uracil DNA glycosylase